MVLFAYICFQSLTDAIQQFSIPHFLCFGMVDFLVFIERTDKASAVVSVVGELLFLHVFYSKIHSHFGFNHCGGLLGGN